MQGAIDVVKRNRLICLSSSSVAIVLASICMIWSQVSAYKQALSESNNCASNRNVTARTNIIILGVFDIVTRKIFCMLIGY